MQAEKKRGQNSEKGSQSQPNLGYAKRDDSYVNYRVLIFFFLIISLTVFYVQEKLK